MTITADTRTAVERFVQSFVELAESLGLQVPTAAAPRPTAKPGPKKTGARKKFSPIDANTPAAVREERQRLILAELVAHGGVVPREDWVAIAGRFGYDPRRLGGFFTKSGGIGMLEMTPDRKTVRLTEHGRGRL